jgi:glycine hydroxymethyltransferase
LGTPALTTRGCKEAEMENVAELIDEALKVRADESEQAKVKEKVREFSLRFPVPGIE